MKKRVGIYVRVSTQEQAKEGYSIEAQTKILKQYAELQQWDTHCIYSDEGISGKNIEKRPSLNQLINDCKTGKLDVVLVWKISRLSRNMYDTLSLFKLFDNNNVSFLSYSENFDSSTAIGKLALQIMASVAEMERATLAENVKMGMTQKALSGGWNGGSLLGYDNVKSKLIVNTSEAKAVTEIYNLYNMGKGLKAVVNAINQMGYRTKKGNLFSIHGVALILDNPTYIGKLRWNQLENWSEKRRAGKNKKPILSEGIHEPIISIELWNSVQERRKKRYHKHYQSSNPFILISLIKCPVCLSTMVASQSTKKNKDGSRTKYSYYMCGRFHNMGTKACSSNGINKFTAEEQVFKILKEFTENVKFFNSKINEINEGLSNNFNKSIKELNNAKFKLNELKSQQNKYFSAFESGTLPIDLIKDRLQEIKDNISITEQKISDLDFVVNSHHNKTINSDLLHKIFRVFLEVYEKSTPYEKKDLLKLLIKDIYITNNQKNRNVKQIVIDFDFPSEKTSKSLALLYKLFSPDNKKENELVVENNQFPSFLKDFLPLLVIRFTPINPKRPIDLLQQEHPYHLMWECHL